MIAAHDLDSLICFLFSFSPFPLDLYPDLSFLSSHEGENLKGKQLAILFFSSTATCSHDKWNMTTQND